jgi:Protein of unknown function (DUF2630)
MTSAFYGGESPGPREDLEEERTPAGIREYAEIEGLVGEEYALLEKPAEERSKAQHHRLREIEEQLDRVWHKLEERAEKRGLPGTHKHDSGGA